MAQERINRIFSHIQEDLDEGSAAAAAPTAGLSHYTPEMEPPPTSAGFELTLDTDVLTLEQREQYERDGFLVIRGLVDPADLERYRVRFQAICDGDIPAPPTMLVMRDVSVANRQERGERAITKIQDYMDDEVLFSYCQTPEILRYVRAFCGNDIKACHTMLINKPPGVGSTSRHPLHQDAHYFPFGPRNRIVCSWTAMEHVHRQNGCLVVLPGTHRNPGVLLQHEYPEWEGGVNKMYHGVRDYDKSQPLTYLEMQPGDTVFFHPLLLHGSGTNRTEGFRKAISCHYASAHCRYYDISGTVQENIADEIKELAMKKYGVEIDFCDVWRAKSRHVSGEADDDEYAL